jgi:hypothetical protein
MEWVRSSRCHTTNCCVEVAVFDNGDILVRDSNSPSQSPLWFSPEEWKDFLAGVKAGEFDLH